MMRRILNAKSFEASSYMLISQIAGHTEDLQQMKLDTRTHRHTLNTHRPSISSSSKSQLMAAEIGGEKNASEPKNPTKPQET